MAKRKPITDKNEAIAFIWDHADVNFYHTICDGGGYMSSYDFLDDFELPDGCTHEGSDYLSDDPVVLCIDPSLLDDIDVWMALAVTGKCQFKLKFLLSYGPLFQKIDDLFENDPRTHGRERYESMRDEAIEFRSIVRNIEYLKPEELDLLDKLPEFLFCNSCKKDLISWLLRFGLDYNFANQKMYHKLIESARNKTVKANFSEYFGGEHLGG